MAAQGGAAVKRGRLDPTADEDGFEGTFGQFWKVVERKSSGAGHSTTTNTKYECKICNWSGQANGVTRCIAHFARIAGHGIDVRAEL
jgi:hypothetical protein